MATMRDVAKRADVSVSTVSHVVNNSRAVSLAARERVLEAMQELGYKPNIMARNLRRQRSNTIGMIVPDSTNPFFAEVARGIEDAGFAHNFSVILCNTDGDIAKQLAYTNALIENQVAGIVFVAAGVSTAQVQELQKRAVPLVIVDREVDGVHVDTVLTNHYQGGCLATQHLLDLGHQRVACITGGSDLSPSADRGMGYQDVLAANGLAYNTDLLQGGDFQYAGGYLAAKQLLTAPNRPTAIFACNDLMAVGCISAARELGLSVPEDLSVVGFDDVKLASFTNPPLTTIAQPTYKIGTLAIEMLLDRLQKGDALPRLERLDTKLVIRHSTAPPRATLDTF